MQARISNGSKSFSVNATLLLLITAMFYMRVCQAVDREYVSRLPAQKSWTIVSGWEYKNEYKITVKPDCATVVEARQDGSNYFFKMEFSEAIGAVGKPHHIEVEEKQYGPDYGVVGTITHKFDYSLFLFHFAESKESILVRYQARYKTEVKPAIDGKYLWEIGVHDCKTSPKKITNATKAVDLTAPTTGTPVGGTEKIKVTFTDVDGIRTEVSVDVTIQEPKSTIPLDTDWVDLVHNHDQFHDTWMLICEVSFTVLDQNKRVVKYSGIPVTEQADMRGYNQNKNIKLLKGDITLRWAVLVDGVFNDDFFANMKGDDYDDIGANTNPWLYTVPRTGTAEVLSGKYVIRKDSITLNFKKARSMATP